MENHGRYFRLQKKRNPDEMSGTFLNLSLSRNNFQPVVGYMIPINLYNIKKTAINYSESLQANSYRDH